MQNLFIATKKRVTSSDKTVTIDNGTKIPKLQKCNNRSEKIEIIKIENANKKQIKAKSILTVCDWK